MLRFPIFFLLLLAGATTGAQEAVYPTIPAGMVELYTPELLEEQLESIRVERLLLKGSNPIRMDFISGHQFLRRPGVSAFFQIPLNPAFSTSLVVFPERGFSGGLSVDSLNLYLDGKAAKSGPEQAFQILERAAEVNTGPAKFRIFGIRALNIRYSETVEEERFTTGENWIEQEGTVFVVVVRAPSESFDRYFKRVAAALNSMNRVQ